MTKLLKRLVHCALYVLASVTMTRNVYLLRRYRSSRDAFGVPAEIPPLYSPFWAPSVPAKSVTVAEESRSTHRNLLLFPFLGTQVPRKLRKFRGGLAEYPRRARGERGEPVCRKTSLWLGKKTESPFPPLKFTLVK